MSHPPTALLRAVPVRHVHAVAVTAVALGVLAVSLSLVPFVNVWALVAGAGAVALGLLVRHRVADGGAGRGLATTGAALGGLAVTVTVLVLFAVGAIYTTQVGDGPGWEDAVVGRVSDR